MTKPARFPRLAFTSVKPPRAKGPALRPAAPVAFCNNTGSERRQLEHELRGARLTPRERRRIELQIEALE